MRAIKRGVRVLDINTHTPFEIAQFSVTDKGILIASDKTGERWTRVEEIKQA